MSLISCAYQPSQHISVVLQYQQLVVSRRSYVPAGHCAPALFSRQMDFMAGRGWQATALSALIERCRCGEGPPDNEFCITFDDGFESVYAVAYPALRQRGLSAIVYIPTASIGKTITWNERLAVRLEPVMTAGQIKELANDCFEIGSHTVSHPMLTKLSDEDLRRELIDSKQLLEDITGREVTSLSYPYGDYDQRVLDACLEAGYRSAVCQRLSSLSSPMRLFEIPRISVRWNTIGAVLLRNIGHGHTDCEDKG